MLHSTPTNINHQNLRSVERDYNLPRLHTYISALAVFVSLDLHYEIRYLLFSDISLLLLALLKLYLSIVYLHLHSLHFLTFIRSIETCLKKGFKYVRLLLFLLL